MGRDRSKRTRHLLAVVVSGVLGCDTSARREPPSDPPGSFDTSGLGDGGVLECVQDPSYYDVPGDGCDNDGDGKVDNPEVCDDDEDGGSAESLARGIGICAKADVHGYGLVSAKLTRGYGREDPPKLEQHGLLPKFGDVLRPHEGKKLAVLSTGWAQEFNGAPGEPFSRGTDWWGYGGGKVGTGTAPPGFPKPAKGCPQVSWVNDVVDLRLVLKAPKNASGFAFDFDFHSGEWPAFVCSKYNDGFIAYLSAKSYGAPDNISFDATQNPVSVNNGFFDRCTKGIRLGCGDPTLDPSACPGGPDELAGTGFGIVGDACGQEQPSTLGGATGWLFSQAPVLPGETFTLDFMIWDTGDGVLDSSVLIDAFRWIRGDVVTGTDRSSDPK